MLTEWLKSIFGIVDTYTAPRPQITVDESEDEEQPVVITTKTRDYSIFSKNNVLPDSIFPYGPGYDITKFLESKKSAILRVETEDGEPMGEKLVSLMYDACVKYDVNPKLLLVSLQREQSLITGYNKAVKIPQRVLDRALGFGCTDSGDMPKYYGFETQVNNCVRIYRKWFDYGKTKLNQKFVVDDGRDIVMPEDQFTYALYKYCPHIGWDKSPRNMGGTYGNCLTWQIWKIYFPEDMA